MVLTFYYFLGNEKYPGKYVLLCLDCLGILFTNMIWNVCAWECFLFLWKKSIRNTFIICETQIIRKPQRRAQYKRWKHQLLICLSYSQWDAIIVFIAKFIIIATLPWNHFWPDFSVTQKVEPKPVNIHIDKSFHAIFKIIDWGPDEILPVHARCMRASTLRKFSIFFFSTGIVCPDIEMTRSVEKNEFRSQGAVLEPVHVMDLVCMHASKTF